MTSAGWRRGAYGLGAEMGATLHGRRTVLVVAHHLASATRLVDVVSLVERDRRVQTAYTVAPASVFSVGVVDFLRRTGGALLPWQQAVNTEWDLAIAAGHGALEQIHGPVLWMPHGIPPNRHANRWAGSGRPVTRPIVGLRRDAFVAGGRVIPSAIAVAHEDHRVRLAEVCPEAAESVVVAGDFAFDRIVASRSWREAYRRRLDVDATQQLIVVSSTWGSGSLFGRHEDLLVRLAAELPREKYKVAVVLHPSIWSWHSRRTVRAWLDDCLRLGAQLVPPEEGWRAALVAADRIIGDYGSVTYYGAAIGVPVLLAAFPDDDVLPGSQAEFLGKVAPRLDPYRPLRPQLEAAAHAYSADHYAAFRSGVTSEPGQSARILRRAMYRLMRQREPDAIPQIDPVPLPETIRNNSLWTTR
jgi:hypothetical protein